MELDREGEVGSAAGGDGLGGGAGAGEGEVRGRVDAYTDKLWGGGARVEVGVAGVEGGEGVNALG